MEKIRRGSSSKSVIQNPIQKFPKEKKRAKTRINFWGSPPQEDGWVDNPSTTNWRRTMPVWVRRERLAECGESTPSQGNLSFPVFQQIPSVTGCPGSIWIHFWFNGQIRPKKTTTLSEICQVFESFGPPLYVKEWVWYHELFFFFFVLAVIKQLCPCCAVSVCSWFQLNKSDASTPWKTWIFDELQQKLKIENASCTSDICLYMYAL